MKKTTLPYTETGYFSKLIEDYLKGTDTLSSFYRAQPGDAAFGQQIDLRKDNIDKEWRLQLSKILLSQYAGIEEVAAVAANIKALESSNTYTVVTGHQLNLFTGPLYFLFKITHAIKLCSHLKKVYPDHDFVPVYWMATEDHDFEEISYFRLKGRNIHWNRKAEGAVGRLSTDGLEDVYNALDKELGPGDHGDALRKLFKTAYLEHDTLTEATRFLAHSLFGKYGLVIVDGDDRRLKSRFAPFIKKDLEEKLSYHEASESAEKLAASGDYHVQVNPREINYFFLEDGLRERLEEVEGKFQVVGTDRVFSREELLALLESQPEKFSPNVITRPLYQEVVLPNLAYIGGGGELAYWLELKSFFEVSGVPFPILCLRNSALLVPKKEASKADRLGVTLQDLFLDRHSLLERKVRAISEIEIDMSPLKDRLSKQFEYLYGIAEKTDPSFLGAVKAQEVKQTNGLDHLEKRLLKAQKRKLEDHVKRLSELQERLFPNQGLQERQVNFSEIYLETGDSLIPALLEAFDVYPEDFTILTY